jgi:hypothetical protein
VDETRQIRINCFRELRECVLPERWAKILGRRNESEVDFWLLCDSHGNASPCICVLSGSSHSTEETQYKRSACKNEVPACASAAV